MAVPYGGLGYSSYFLALLYFCLSVFASAKFHRLSTRISAWSTTKFFLLSLVFQTILRALAFITMVIIKAENVDTTSGGIFDECAQVGFDFAEGPIRWRARSSSGAASQRTNPDHSSTLHPPPFPPPRAESKAFGGSI